MLCDAQSNLHRHTLNSQPEGAGSLLETPTPIQKLKGSVHSGSKLLSLQSRSNPHSTLPCAFPLPPDVSTHKNNSKVQFWSCVGNEKTRTLRKTVHTVMWVMFRQINSYITVWFEFFHHPNRQTHTHTQTHLLPTDTLNFAAKSNACMCTHLCFLKQHTVGTSCVMLCTGRLTINHFNFMNCPQLGMFPGMENVLLMLFPH